MGSRRVGGRLDTLMTGRQVAIDDILAHGAVEEKGLLLHQADLPWPCAWVMGHEEQGVAPSLEARSSLRIRIAQPGGEESLNVAAAAAICLHASGAAR